MTDTYQSNHYLDKIAHTIWEITSGSTPLTEDQMRLYRIYAVLCLGKGEEVTNEDVHNAWVAWTLSEGNGSSHPSTVPYKSLKPHVQELDTEFTNAIREVYEAFCD